MKLKSINILNKIILFKKIIEKLQRNCNSIPSHAKNFKISRFLGMARSR